MLKTAINTVKMPMFRKMHGNTHRHRPLAHHLNCKLRCHFTNEPKLAPFALPTLLPPLKQVYTRQVYLDMIGLSSLHWQVED